jgi:hypothetical protein
MLAPLVELDRRVEHRGAEAEPHERVDLVLHQRDEREITSTAPGSSLAGIWNVSDLPEPWASRRCAARENGVDDPPGRAGIRGTRTRTRAPAAGHGRRGPRTAAWAWAARARSLHGRERGAGRCQQCRRTRDRRHAGSLPGLSPALRSLSACRKENDSMALDPEDPRLTLQRNVEGAGTSSTSGIRRLTSPSPSGLRPWTSWCRSNGACHRRAAGVRASACASSSTGRCSRSAAATPHELGEAHYHLPRSVRRLRRAVELPWAADADKVEALYATGARDPSRPRACSPASRRSSRAARPDEEASERARSEPAPTDARPATRRAPSRRPATHSKPRRAKSKSAPTISAETVSSPPQVPQTELCAPWATTSRVHQVAEARRSTHGAGAARASRCCSRSRSCP